MSSWYGLLLLFAFQLPVILAGAIIIARSRSESLPRWLDLALLLTSLTFAFAATELTLGRFVRSPAFMPAPRAFVGEFENRSSKHFVADPATGWRMRSNIEFRWWVDRQPTLYHANRQGFRSEIDFDHAQPGRLIIVVGDSFAFGTGVEAEETFAALLDEHLNEGIVVRNLAMPGFGLDQMWMSVRHQALPMNPMLIILAFIDEDLDRSLTAYRRVEGFNKPTFELDGGGLRPQVYDDRPHSAWRYLERHSAVYAGLSNLLRQFGYQARFGDWWLRNEAIFKAVIAESREAGVPVLFVRLPSKPYREFPNLHRLMDGERANLLDLETVDLLPSHAIHFVNDAHINRAGHEFVADQVRTWIKERFPETAAAGKPPASHQRTGRESP